MKRAFIDTDYLVEELYHMNQKEHLSCYEIYKELGPADFRFLEYEVIQSLQDLQRSVIAVGGGSMLIYENVEALKKKSHLFYLFYEKELLKQRLFTQHPYPAFLDPNNPDSSFDHMFNERDEVYRKLGAEIIDITQMKRGEIVTQICKFAKIHGK